MQAIETKYFGPGNVRGSRIKASCEADTITIPYPHEASGGVEGAHLVAARALCAKLGWEPQYLACGGIPSNKRGYVFVPVYERNPFNLYSKVAA